MRNEEGPPKGLRIGISWKISDSKLENSILFETFCLFFQLKSVKKETKKIFSPIPLTKLEVSYLGNFGFLLLPSNHFPLARPCILVDRMAQLT